MGVNSPIPGFELVKLNTALIMMQELNNIVGTQKYIGNKY